MNITEVPFAVLRFQYQLARFPLRLIESRVVTRLNSEAPARLLYERSLGRLDTTVGNVLRDPKLVEGGAALIERSNTLAHAAKLEGKATTKKQQADAQLKSASDEAIEERKEARAATERRAEAATKTAREREQKAAEAAQKRTATAKEHADELAAKRKSQVESAKRQDEARIRAAEKSATEAAKSKLDDAQEKLGEAASKRARADQVEELADVEKDKRKAERANNSS
jgi:hypothetical protein